MKSDNMEDKKQLKIKITETKEGSTTNFKVEGLSDFEIIGILSYYLDAYKVKMMRSSEKSKLKQDE